MPRLDYGVNHFLLFKNSKISNIKYEVRQSFFLPLSLSFPFPFIFLLFWASLHHKSAKILIELPLYLLTIGCAHTQLEKRTKHGRNPLSQNLRFNSVKIQVENVDIQKIFKRTTFWESSEVIHFFRSTGRDEDYRQFHLHKFPFPFGYLRVPLWTLAFYLQMRLQVCNRTLGFSFSIVKSLSIWHGTFPESQTEIFGLINGKRRWCSLHFVDFKM